MSAWIALDSSLKAGDVIATSDGLVAYTGVRLGNDQTAEFTPVASYPGLTAQVVEDAAEVGQDVARRILELAQLPQRALPTRLLDLEVLELDQHRGQRLGHAVVKLPSENPPDFVGAGRAFAIHRLERRLANDKRSHAFPFPSLPWMDE